MNRQVMITSDSTCDLPEELISRYNIKKIPLSILHGGKTYLDDVDYHTQDIYAQYKIDGTLPRTASPSLQAFLDFFEGFVSQGYDVVHLDISSELSSTCSTAKIAAEEIGNVYVVDSRQLSSGVGLLLIEAAECREKGMGAEEIADRLTAMADKVDTSFVLDTLEYMWKGGRCSGVAALGANLLKLKPALEMRNGKLEVYKKYRGNMKNVYKQYVTERLAGKDVYGRHIFITDSYGVSEETVAELRDIIFEKLGDMEFHYSHAGCTIASHCGDGCLGVLFINK